MDEDQSDTVGNVSIAVTASLSLAHQLSSLPHNLTTVTGFLPLGGLSFNSSHMLHILIELGIDLRFSDMLSF